MLPNQFLGKVFSIYEVTMVKLKSFNASLYCNFINCESSYGSLVAWLCDSLFIVLY